jgi:hypothetical protein
VFNLAKTGFYQNDVLFDARTYTYFGVMCRCIQGGIYVVDIDFQPLGLKSDSKEGGIPGTEV